MKQQPIVDELAGLGFAQTGGVLEYAAVQTIPGQLPAAFVVPQGEVAAEPARMSVGAIDQKVTWTFAVVVILPAGARRPEAISEAIELWSGKLKQLFVGWTHPDASGPTTFGDAQLVGAGANAVSWAVRFRCPYHLRKVS